MLVLVGRLKIHVVLWTNIDSDVYSVLRTIRVGHINRDGDLARWHRVFRNVHGHFAGVRINRHILRRKRLLVALRIDILRCLILIRIRSELGALRGLGVLAVLVLEVRSVDYSRLTRLTISVLVFRLKSTVLVRNLRVGAVLLLLVIRDAVAVVVLILGVRRAVTIGVQLEVCGCVVLRTVRVGHLDRDIEVLDSLSVQLLRSRHSDFTGGLVDIDRVALRSSEVIRDGELRTLRRVDGLLGDVAVLVLLLDGRRRRLRLTRNNSLVLILRLDRVSIRRCNNKRRDSWCRGAICVGHLHRHIGLVTRRRIRREGHRNLTGLLVDPNLVALWDLEIGRNLELRRLLLLVLSLELVRAQLLDVIGLGVVEGRRLRSELLANLALSNLILRHPAHQHGKRIGGDTTAAFTGLLIDRVQVRRERRRRINTVREQLGITSIQWARRKRGISSSSLNLITGLDNLTSVRVDPLNLVVQILNELRRNTRGLRLHLITRLSRIIAGVMRCDIELDVIRVQRHIVRTHKAGLGLVHLRGPTVIRVVPSHRQVTVGVERRRQTSAFSLLRGDKQPIPVDVLRQVFSTTTSRARLPGTVLRGRRNRAKQAIRVVLRPIRERHLRTVITRQIGVDQRTVVIATRLTAPTEGALKLQGVVAVLANDGLGGLGDPLVLAFFGHLAFDPVLQRSFLITRPPTATDLIDFKVLRSFLVNRFDRVVRQVRAVDLQPLSGHIRLVVGVRQVLHERALGAPQVPEDLALHLAVAGNALTGEHIFLRVGHVVHVVARLLTECETHILNAVGANKPLHATRNVIGVAVGAK